MATAVHECRFRPQTMWSAWEPCAAPREGLREREARVASRCATCGRERAEGAAAQRPPGRTEVEAIEAAAPPVATPESRRIAAVIVRRAPSFLRMAAGRGLLEDFAKTGLTQAEIDHWLDAFARAGWLRLGYRVSGAERSLDRVMLRDPAALAEHAAIPGDAAAKTAPAQARGVDELRQELAALDHPAAARIARLLEEKPNLGGAQRIVETVAAVARHAASGEVITPRAFSAKYLGDAQQLGRMRFLIEGLLGPLSQLGIREGGPLVHIGGAGRVRLGASGRAMLVDLERVPPYLALAPDGLARTRALELPDGGLLVVQAFSCFEAACRGEVGLRKPVTVVWSAGYPGPGVRRLVEEAAEAGARVRVWADLDYDGVRIARLVASWAGDTFETWRMAPADLAAAAQRTPLSPASAAAIRADLAAEPDALLADTLSAILEAKACAESD